MLASPSIGMKAAGVEGRMNAQRNRRYRNEIATGREEDPLGTRAVSHRSGLHENARGKWCLTPKNSSHSACSAAIAGQCNDDGCDTYDCAVGADRNDYANLRCDRRLSQADGQALGRNFPRKFFRPVARSASAASEDEAQTAESSEPT